MTDSPEPDEENEPMPTTQEISGMGRDELVAAVHRLQFENMALAAERSISGEEAITAWREVKALTDNVTSLQQASNHALTCKRLERRLTEEPALTAALLDVAWAIDVARKKHPEGSDLTSLVSEVGEVARAMYSETPDRVRSELRDVAVVVFRLLLGEVKAEQVGFATGGNAR